MQVRRVDASRGARWVLGGFRLLGTKPLALLALVVFDVFLLLVPSVLPLVGPLVPTLLTPVFGVGLMVAMRATDRGGNPVPQMLFAAFGEEGGHAWRNLLVLGAISAIATMRMKVPTSPSPVVARFSAASLTPPRPAARVPGSRRSGVRPCRPQARRRVSRSRGPGESAGCPVSASAGGAGVELEVARRQPRHRELLGALPSGSDQLRAAVGVGEHLGEGGREAVGVARWGQHRVQVGAGHPAVAGEVAGDDRGSGRHRLQQDDAERLTAQRRRAVRGGGAEARRLLGVGDPSEPLDAGIARGPAAEGGGVRSVTRDPDPDVASHAGERVEEKISLSERFGLWVSFYPFRQDEYLAIVAHWLASFGCGPDEIAEARADALRFALERGSRSGRVAWQFARDWAGRHGHSVRAGGAATPLK